MSCGSTNRYPNIQGIHKRMVQFQKLTRNLFLALHGHNVHHQKLQLSKFLVCYQQFASHAYCAATGPVSKMASQQEKAFCVLRSEVSRSVITVQREFRAWFRTSGSAKLNSRSRNFKVRKGGLDLGECSITGRKENRIRIVSRKF
jgi:hypothetical protein